MIRNVAVKRRETEYQENIERAKESAALGAELRQVFERSKTLGSLEQKKLARLEKLARAIREKAGGDDDKQTLRDLPTGGLETSLARIQELAAELQARVEKTPRHVISTAVINTANELLEVIKHIRAAFK
jgi:molecular chaperone GrpE (heat shock protein)